MDPSPSSKLEADLEAGVVVFPDEPSLSPVHSFCHPRTYPPGFNTDLEPLRYIKYTANEEGEIGFGTIQEFQDEDEARRHWETQRKYKDEIFIHPDRCWRDGDKYVLFFPKIIRDFKGCWVNIHTKGDDHSRVTDVEMWEIFKKIGKNLKYLSLEAKSRRPHGNLLNGIGITSDLQALFLNLGDNCTDPMLYEKDAKDLHQLLSSVTLTDKAIKGYVDNWISFLSDSCVNVQPDFTISSTSAIHPPYENHDHVRLIFSYPRCWSSRDALRFLANMHRLCKGKDRIDPVTKKKKINLINLMNNPSFRAHLVKCYSQWNNCFINSALNKVYQDRQSYYLDKNGMLNPPTIVHFAHNCIKYYPKHLEGHEILGKVLEEFPHLLDDFYQAFYKAVAQGYIHPAFSVEQILTQKAIGNWRGSTPFN